MRSLDPYYLFHRSTVLAPCFEFQSGDIIEIYPEPPQKGQFVLVVIDGVRKIGVCHGKYLELSSGIPILLTACEILGVVRRLQSN